MKGRTNLDELLRQVPAQRDKILAQLSPKQPPQPEPAPGGEGYDDGCEDEFQVDAEKLLTEYGIPRDAFLHLSKKAREHPGWPDLTFSYYSRFVALELKTGKNVPSADQKRVGAALQLCGAIWRVCWTLAEIREVLDDIKQKGGD